MSAGYRPESASRFTPSWELFIQRMNWVASATCWDWEVTEVAEPPQIPVDGLSTSHWGIGAISHSHAVSDATRVGIFWYSVCMTSGAPLPAWFAVSSLVTAGSPPSCVWNDANDVLHP